MVIGLATLLVRFLLPAMSRRSPALLNLAILLSYVVMFTAVAGLLLGRRATQRVADSGDVRGMTLGYVGTLIGWSNVVLTVAGFVLSPFQTIIDNAPH